MDDALPDHLQELAATIKQRAAQMGEAWPPLIAELRQFSDWAVALGREWPRLERVARAQALACAETAAELLEVQQRFLRRLSAAAEAWREP